MKRLGVTVVPPEVGPSGEGVVDGLCVEMRYLRRGCRRVHRYKARAMPDCACWLRKGVQEQGVQTTAS